MRARPVTILMAALLVAALATIPEIGESFDPDGSSRAAIAADKSCGAGAGEALAKTAGAVAERIYAGEHGGPETVIDKHQVESYAPLVRALESGESSAINTAVTSLVFSHTHIVRLRVTRGSKVLADVGGPYILAPAGGTLRSHGRSLAHYVLSVQDDLGYLKLVNRFLEAPLILRTGSGQVPVKGLLSPGPSRIPDHGPLVYRQKTYEAFSFNAEAYPSGRLRISLLLPVSHSLEAKSCIAIKAAEMGLVTRHVSRRYSLSPANFANYARLAGHLTDGLVLVRSGKQTLAGNTRPGPPRLPSSGSVRYHGKDYAVTSFQAPTSIGTVRVYTLIAP